jgi:hypothetical protein
VPNLVFISHNSTFHTPSGSFLVFKISTISMILATASAAGRAASWDLLMRERMVTWPSAASFLPMTKM